MKEMTSCPSSPRRLGQWKYENGHPLSSCSDEQERRGWLEAKRADALLADAETEAWLASQVASGFRKQPAAPAGG